MEPPDFPWRFTPDCLFGSTQLGQAVGVVGKEVIPALAERDRALEALGRFLMPPATELGNAKLRVTVGVSGQKPHVVLPVGLLAPKIAFACAPLGLPGEVLGGQRLGCSLGSNLA